MLEGNSKKIDFDSINSINWDKHPIIPVIVQNKVDLVVLMLAYTNKETLTLSLNSSIAHYFSRSRNRIWKKGEQSGNIQVIKEIYLDCDNDTILFLVDQVNVACHTGNYSCFFKKIGHFSTNKQDNLKEKCIIDKLYDVISARKFENSIESYTSSMFSKGENQICKKVIEEAGEFTFAIKDNKENEIIYEGGGR